jgi:hypothetical protein
MILGSPVVTGAAIVLKLRFPDPLRTLVCQRPDKCAFGDGGGERLIKSTWVLKRIRDRDQQILRSTN